MGVTIRDNNNIPGTLKQLRVLDKKKIKVGIIDADPELEMIAGVHEYGTEITVTDKMRGWFAANGFPLRKDTTKIVIPERSYLRSGFDENKDEIYKVIKTHLPNVLESGTDVTAFMEMVGLQFAGMIQRKLRDLREPANSDMTVQMKGSTNPLVDSGKLIDAIGSKVE